MGFNEKIIHEAKPLESKPIKNKFYKPDFATLQLKGYPFHKFR